MQEHPITTSILHKGLGSLLLLLAIAIQCALLTLYGDLPLSITLVDSLLSIALFAVAGYYLWYVQCTLHIMQARVAFAVLVQIACIAGCSILLQIFGLEDWEEFSITIPFRFLFGLMAWIILSQWYASRERKSEAEPIVRQMEEKTAPPPTTVPEEILDRISVKDGARIHINPDKRDILFASMWRLCDLIHHFRSARKGANHEVFRAKPSFSGVRSYTPLLYR